MLNTIQGTDYSYIALLGRVKAALATSYEIAVDVAEVRPYPGQPRQYFDKEAIKRLAESIDASGQTTAGIIRRNVGATEYELIDGERRWWAVSSIPEERRPQYRARLIEADDEVVQYLISGIANFNREGHTPLETCDTICRLVALELPMKEIAGLLGIHVHWAYNMHSLRQLVPQVKQMLNPELKGKNRLPTTAAIEISKCAPKLQLGLAQRVMRREISLVGLRTEVISVSKAAGITARTRTIDPNSKWKMIERQVRVAERAAVNTQEALATPGLEDYIKMLLRFRSSDIDHVDQLMLKAIFLLQKNREELAKLRNIGEKANDQHQRPD